VSVHVRVCVSVCVCVRMCVCLEPKQKKGAWHACMCVRMRVWGCHGRAPVQVVAGKHFGAPQLEGRLGIPRGNVREQRRCGRPRVRPLPRPTITIISIHGTSVKERERERNRKRGRCRDIESWGGRTCVHSWLENRVKKSAKACAYVKAEVCV
jgi:hypothetical protein